MSIHRGGPPGAVAAVSYNSMASLSPTRRFSSSTTGTTTSSGISSGTTTTKFNTCRSSKALDHTNYSSPTSTSYLSGSRKNHYSPARSVSSYSEGGSVSLAASKLPPKFSSTSTSSASSTTSSASSASNNRERFSLPASSNLSLSDGEFRSKYSPDNYVPSIYRNNSNSSLSSNSSTLNGHCKSFPLSSSTSGLAELHGGDERDSIGYREHRDRSYSNEISSSLVGGDRWSSTSNRHIKRRNNPLNTVLTGSDEIDSAPAATEVTHHPSSSSSSSLEQDHDIIPDIARNNLHHGNVNNTAIALVDNDNNNANNNNDHDPQQQPQQQQYADDEHRIIINNHHDHDYSNGDHANDDNNLNHHGHPTLADHTQRSSSAIPSSLPIITTTSSTLTTATTLLQSSSPSSSSLSSFTDHQFTSPVDSPASESYNSTATTPMAIGPITSVTDNENSYNTLSSLSVTSGDGDGSAAAPADHRACSWTKIQPPTNPDNNTELLTNNNHQDNSCNNSVLFGGTFTREISSLGDTLLESSVPSITSARLSIRDSSNNSPTQWTLSNDSNQYNNQQQQQQQQQQQSHHHQVIKRDTNNCDNDADDGFDEISLDPSDTENNLLDKNLSNIASTDSVIENLKDNDSEVDSIMIQSWKGHTGGNPSSIVDDTKVTSRPAGTHNDDSGKASTSRSLFDWDDSPSDAASRFNPSSSSSTSSTAANNTSNSPVGVHQAISRGVNEQIEESSSSRPPRSSRIPTRRDENYGLNGLRNIGNTCFMNSVIQCLSNTKPLLEYLLNEQYLNDINQSTSSMKGALIKVFAQVINELWESSGDHVVNTSSLKHQIQRFAPRFMGYAQQDAQEFLRYLLEGLHEDVNRVAVKPQPILTDIPDNFTDSQKAAESWKRYLRSEDSTIVDVFVGQLRSSLQCTSCDHISVTLDPFWDLSLPIPARSGTVKLNQCLEHFTKTEIMDGDEKPTCSKCQMRRKCTKRFSIQKFPKILVIHLKRFSPTERFRAKLSVLVDFPLTGLDLSAFAATGVQGCTYNLYGVANHSGTPYSGHYTAYCKHPYSGEWHEYNDSRVSSVSASSVISSEAYVLFYEQQTQSQQQQSSQSSQQQQQPLSHHL
ncbi:ubiquitin carboxyl-terminal hydrolase Usp2 isoform X1 [Microplitis demolitor]|uniref:ubiquitin carboxyl-terminal hydrolase Usp2 isoform X1 n=1 Tax=Microplitis demolitor TaxID=69319 RepID=UPI00044000FD|nr:ubiquitin carboxyl-terminal hydrolase Usp2 isoform X1 [Microplitis demolitor]XP_053598712.1 ubiquitin carboxyl-terminal hydrolase Usp2 isoform X1 [Microplitis demolitor]XP_053598713.1 ubiquitin carboxyl-terminal hydrolase Usp2 isoform X1 [Microplitis demolitor]XP_053598714.1 ubiquitin carboxyl-terminal hydrolase Usp2 isoform X1 [Microplitis demolitor]XP_053598715.1 ubiquitin carboxyl-terminal hydrolase Usp2 isoform X1 [Microplitis demolitor]